MSMILYTRGGQLTAEEKAENKRISRERIYIEHINAKIVTIQSLKNSSQNPLHMV